MSTFDEGLESVRDGAKATKENIKSASEYTGDKLVDGKDAVVDTSSSTLGKVGDSVKGGMQSVGNGLSNVGEYIGDKYEGVKKAMTLDDCDKTPK